MPHEEVCDNTIRRVMERKVAEFRETIIMKFNGKKIWIRCRRCIEPS